MKQSRIVAGIGALLVAVALALSAPSSSDQSEPAQLEFLKKYWDVPVPPQGTPPATFSALESSLDPSSCGSCHQKQFEDWKTTIHSRSIGPGLLGQTPAFLRKDPETAVMCYTCHAPLAEQQEIFQGGSAYKKNPTFDAGLQGHGITCAGCHVRNHQRFGPPPRNAAEGETAARENTPHNGATFTAAFERAEFCMRCHQFQSGDRELNGKFLENTYNEWKAGAYGRAGIPCQQCHMPDRRHLWRGIHDPDMVKRGVEVDVRTNQSRYNPGDTLEAELTLTNRAVGHDFPTYVTPKVILQMELVDAAGHPLPGSRQQEVVGREVTIDITQELFDTRIPPKAKHTFRYLRTIPQQGLKLRVAVTVYPDDFYRRFYEAKRTERLTAVERKLLGVALERARSSSYPLFEKEIPL